MRTIGFVITVLGGLALGVEGFADVLGVAPPVRVPPLASGIALVFGLLMLTSDRRDEDEP